IKKTASNWMEDRAPRLGAALSYYAVFSLVPFLIVVIAIWGLICGREASRGEIISKIGGLVGERSAKAVQKMIQAASQPKQGILGSIVGLGALLLGASGVFGQLQDALNTVWGVKPKPGRGLMGIIKD